MRQIEDSGSEETRPQGTVLIQASDERSAAEWICGGVHDWLEASGYDLKTQVQVLSPMKAGEAGTNNLNKRLRARLNPGDGRPARIRVGDAMIQLTNDYDAKVFNGDVGRVASVVGKGFSVQFDSPSPGAPTCRM